MDASIIVCTYNRAALLEQCLKYLALQVTPPELTWEVVVVDNNCTDGTEEILRRARDSFPVGFRSVREEKQGLSHARNRGIAEAKGRYLLFTDDDIEPAADWVASMWSTFERSRCDGVAGRVELKWLCERPPWMTEELKGFLAHVDYGAREFQLGKDLSPIGANMAYTASVFARVGGFDPSLGRNGDKLVGGEEIDLFERFLAAELTAVYQPRSVVYHSVDRDRARKSYFRFLHFNSGKIKGLRYIPGGKKLLGVPLFVLPQLVRSFMVFLETVVKEGSNRSLRQELTVWYFVGFILGCAQAMQRKSRVMP
jgi:glucosyl-dolichyl phosphate glucuronosyltransferase